MPSLKRSAPIHDACPCCGGQRTRLTGVVLEGDAPQGVYFATFTEKHPEAQVDAVVSLGDFSRDATPEDRVAFAFTLRRGAEGAIVQIGDATRCLWREVDWLGKRLPREEGLSHPRVREVHQVAERLLMDDPQVLPYLARAGDAQGPCTTCTMCGKH